MDPISAIGLASAILTFIDCAHKIVTGVGKLHKSVTGATEENTRTHDIVNDLHEATADLITLDGKTEHEKALNDLAAKCKKVSDDLLKLLNELTISGNRSKLMVLKVAMRNFLKEGEVVKMVATLGEYRSQILLRLSLMLNDQQCSNKLELIDKIDSHKSTLSTESDARLAKLREDILNDVTQLLKKDAQEKPSKTHSQVSDGSCEVQQSLKNLYSMMSTVHKQNIILQNIFFPSMSQREETMGSAEDGTFQWIFEEEDVSSNHIGNEFEYPGDSNPFVSQNESLSDKIKQSDRWERATARDNFLSWLRSGGGLFHISGKAGSGKSTLMKFLCSHKCTKEELKVWAGKQRKLVLARFYFWKSSNDSLQMSLPGLQRSIIFETLKYCPELIPHLFQTQWKMLTNGFPYVPGSLINDVDVKNAFEALTTKCSFSHYRFCFFIDGLDEYDGQMTDHLKLASDLQQWASGDDVKICASSRPYIQFDKLATSSSRVIHLHQLTKHDIYLFSRKMIEENLKDDLQWVKSYYLRLVEKVVQKSEGVFLWARLVVCSLLEGMLRRDKEEMLEHKLDILPPDINDLYTELLNTLSPDDRVRAKKMMLLKAHEPFYIPLSSVVYAFVDQLADPKFPPRDGHKPASWESYHKTAKYVQLQLKSLTKGLLETVPIRKTSGEMSKRSSVQFFHRTVRDFILEHSKLEDTMRQFPSLTKVDTYYRLWLAELILDDLPARFEAWNKVRYDVRGRKVIFQQELTPSLLESFSRVFEDADCIWKAAVRPYRGFEFMEYTSCRSRGDPPYRQGNASFICLAAYTGQQEYVLQQIKKNPGLLRGNGECHILLSAALNGQTEMARALLREGSSPTDCVAFTSRRTKRRAIPIWMAFITHLIVSGLHHQAIQETKYEVLELLLKDKRVDASSCFFLLKRERHSEPITHFITLKQFVQDIKPDNANQLLALLVSGARWPFSKFTPFFKQEEFVMDKETCGYTRLLLDEKSKNVQWKFGAAICGDLRIYEYEEPELWMF